jgi:hypothetical protein
MSHFAALPIALVMLLPVSQLFMGSELAPVAESTGTPRPPMARLVSHHLRYHQTFPASRREVLARVEATAELTVEEQRRFALLLPEQVYANAGEALRAAGVESRAPW